MQIYPLFSTLLEGSFPRDGHDGNVVRLFGAGGEAADGMTDGVTADGTGEGVTADGTGEGITADGTGGDAVIGGAEGNTAAFGVSGFFLGREAAGS